jgi:hypothetical protein
MTTVATFDQVLAQIWAGLGLGQQPKFFLIFFFRCNIKLFLLHICILNYCTNAIIVLSFFCIS